ncbi:MAG TPA: polysaccharide deacetylase family protein [Beijerinckiaceae bacterium]|nr:polysaccharide deacetylase family protein [Beijerinckiaceae bacterium]
MSDAQGSGSGAHWPDGVRLPISISMMWEAGSEPMPMIPQQAVPQDAGGKRFPNLSAYTEDQYGWREGIPRLLDMFDRRRIKVSSFLSAKGLEKAPALAREIAERGHECAAHGITHTQQFHLSREDERKFILDGVEIAERLTGQHPVGYNCQGVWRSANTLSLLQELGFLYHVDDFGRDEPYIVPVNGKPFVVMPYTRYLNDLIHYQLQPGDLTGFERTLNEEFAALYEEAETRRRMMVISFHDKLARPARVRIVEAFIARVQAQKGVWFARKDELARFVLDSPATIREAEAT